MENTEPRCIICLRKIKQRSEEHVIPAALGWDQTISCVCRRCNNSFGYTIDSKLVSAFDFERSLLGVKGRTGRLPRISITADEGDWQGRKVGWKKGKIVFPSDAALPQEDGSYRTFRPGPPPETLRRKAEKLGRELEKCGEGRSTAIQRFELGAAVIFDSEALRSIAKSLFNYLALSHEALCASADFDPLRCYLTTSKGFNPWFVLPVVPVIDPPYHRLLLALQGDLHIIHGVVELFGLIAAHVMLTNRYRGATFGLETVIDPVERKVLKDPGPVFDLEEAFSVRPAVLESDEALKDYWIRVFNEALEKRMPFYENRGARVSEGRPEAW